MLKRFAWFRRPSQSDESIADHIWAIDHRAWEDMRLLVYNQNIETFRRSALKNVAAMRALEIRDLEWREVQRLWVAWMAWFDDHDRPTEADNDEMSELREVFNLAFLDVCDRRGVPMDRHQRWAEDRRLSGMGQRPR